MTGRGRRPKIQVYLSSDTKPKTALKLLKATSEVRAKATQPLDPFTGTVLEAIDESARMEAKLAQGTGLFFTLEENDTLHSVKKAAYWLDCEYEIVDLRTGSLIDLDKRTLGIRIIGHKKIDADEFSLPRPCLKVGDAILKLSSMRNLGSKKIMQFYNAVLGPYTCPNCNAGISLDGLIRPDGSAICPMCFKKFDLFPQTRKHRRVY